MLQETLDRIASPYVNGFLIKCHKNETSVNGQLVCTKRTNQNFIHSTRDRRHPRENARHQFSFCT